jgi:O-methyltransferase
VSRTTIRPSRFRTRLRRPWFALWRAVEKLFYRGRRYTVLVPYGNRVLTPWFDPLDDSPFSDAHRVALAGGPVSVSPDRCYMLHQFARRAARLDGDMAECGVYTGGTAHLISETLNGAANLTFHLFDSFQGMPQSAEPERDYHAPGDFAETSVARVQQRLSTYDFVRFHVGFVPATFSDLDPAARFSFVHIDMDIYPSTLDCCRWFWPRMSAGGVMVFDDYGFFPYRAAAQAAVDEFFTNEVEKPILLPTGQAVVFKS